MEEKREIFHHVLNLFLYIFQIKSKALLQKLSEQLVIKLNLWVVKVLLSVSWFEDKTVFLVFIRKGTHTSLASHYQIHCCSQKVSRFEFEGLLIEHRRVENLVQNSKSLVGLGLLRVEGKIVLLKVSINVVGGVIVPHQQVPVHPIDDSYWLESTLQNFEDFLFHVHYLMDCVTSISRKGEVTHLWNIYFFDFTGQKNGSHSNQL